MDHEDIEAVRELVRVDRNYESPVVFDFGSVFDVTRGSGSGNEDDNGQQHK